MLRVGFAREDITPGLDADLLGYDFRQAELPPGNAGVRDPLAVHALVLDDGVALAVWVSLDLCILSPSAARRLRAAVADAVATDPARVIIACSHTHSGPMVADADLDAQLADVLPNTQPGASDDGRMSLSWLAPRVLTAVRCAAGLTAPSRLRVHQAPLGLGYNRRVTTADGVDLCWNPREQTNLAPAPAADPALVVASFEEAAGPRRRVVVNHGAHPVVLGKTSRVISADWPGALIAELESQHADVEACFALGACGDVHPWLATQADSAAVTVVGRAAAAHSALLLQAGGEAHEVSRVSAVAETVTIGGTEVDLTAWRSGPLTWLSAPVELFAELGAQLRAAIPGPVLLATNSNGWTGYWPTEAAFAAGRYEVDAARAHGRDTGCGEALVAALMRLVARLD